MKKWWLLPAIVALVASAGLSWAALESGTYVGDLVITNPVASDPESQGDDHLRLVKSVLKTTFPNATKPFYFPNIQTKSANYTVLATDRNTTLQVSASGGSDTVTLLAAATATTGFMLTVEKSDSGANTVTIDGSGAETINGALTFVLSSQYDTVTIICDGSSWYLLTDVDAALESLGRNATAGLWVSSTTSAGVARTLTAPAAGITVTNGTGVSGNPTLVLANDLSALEGLGSTGIATRTAADTWAQRTLTAPAAGFTITNPAGVAGDPTFVLANDLAGLEGMSGTGLAAHTAANTWTERTLTAGTGISISNGSGVAGNPTISLTNNAGEELLTSGTASGATLNLVLTSYTAYRGIHIRLGGFIPATDGTSLRMRFSTDGGGSYVAATYLSAGQQQDDSGTTATFTTAAGAIGLTGASVGNGTTEGFSGDITLLNQTSSALWSRVFCDGYYISNDATPKGMRVTSGGTQTTAQDTDAVQFFFSSGNITTGNYAVYGIN